MSKERNTHLFNSIAPTYGLFFRYQKKRYATNLLAMKNTIDLSSYNSIIDVGCGTGAFCSALSDLNLEVTGIDPASRMLAIAKKRKPTGTTSHSWKQMYWMGFPSRTTSSILPLPATSPMEWKPSNEKKALQRDEPYCQAPGDHPRLQQEPLPPYQSYRMAGRR